MTVANAVFVFLYTSTAGSLYAVAHMRTGSRYSAMWAHSLADTGPALSLAVPPDTMRWVSLAVVKLSQSEIRNVWSTSRQRTGDDWRASATSLSRSRSRRNACRLSRSISIKTSPIIMDLTYPQMTGLTGFLR
jgi:hypothetical protein